MDVLQAKPQGRSSFRERQEPSESQIGRERNDLLARHCRSDQRGSWENIQNTTFKNEAFTCHARYRLQYVVEHKFAVKIKTHQLEPIATTPRMLPADIGQNFSSPLEEGSKVKKPIARDDSVMFQRQLVFQVSTIAIAAEPVQRVPAWADPSSQLQ